MTQRQHQQHPWSVMYRNATRASTPSNRAVRRQAEQAIKGGAQVFAVLLACLAQKGGEIVITQGTIDQVGANLACLGYVIVPHDDDGTGTNEFTVRMTEGRSNAAV